jgi:hypothetical protein
MPASSNSSVTSKRKSIPTKNPNNEAYERPTKKVRPQRVLSDDEEEELMVEEGIDEVVEIDLDGNEKPGTRRPVRSPSPVSQPSTECPETDEEELGESLYLLQQSTFH